MMIDIDEKQLLIRCPRLGHEIFLDYCLREGGDWPCQRIVRCWQQRFSVENYLKERLGQEAWERFLKQEPQDKMSTLLEIVARAKKRREEAATSSINETDNNP